MIRPLLLTLALVIGCATPPADPLDGCRIILGDPGETSEVVCDD